MSFAVAAVLSILASCTLAREPTCNTGEPTCNTGVESTSDEHISLLQTAASYHLRVEKKEEKAGARGYGNSSCPCVGIDNITGSTLVTIGGSTHDYPADIGARCKAWDDGLYPGSCESSDQTPGTGSGWCADEWCYIDPCNCDLEVLPVTSSYLPDGKYQGKPIFYSYATCGSTDSWTETEHSTACVNQMTSPDCLANDKCAWDGNKCGGKAAMGACSEQITGYGNASCLCIGIDNQPGTTDVLISGNTVPYPADTGASCQAWDQGNSPSCKGENPPNWCQQAWCYVDPCSCGLDVPPVTSSYLAGAKFQGKPVYYSYATCESEDYWTSELHTHACVNQNSEQECGQLEKCAWTGSRCLGEELVGTCTA